MTREGQRVALIAAAPTVTERQLIMSRLRVLALQQVPQLGDGNCQFRALSHQLYGTSSHHRAVRAALCEHLRREAASFEVWCAEEGGLDAYVARMERDGEWGDELTLSAAANHFGVTLHVLTSDAEHFYIRYPAGSCSAVEKHAFLLYRSPVHYDSFTAAVRTRS